MQDGSKAAIRWPKIIGNVILAIVSLFVILIIVLVCKNESLTSGAVVTKTYSGHPPLYQLTITDGDRTRTVSVPESIGDQAEPGDWYDADGVVLTKASGEETSGGA